MTRTPLRPVLAEAVETLQAAGVPSPRADAEQLAAHVLGVPRSRLLLAPLLTPEQLAGLHELVRRRAQRIPLQHLIGHASMGRIDLEVGPGVFIPRPETELVFAWALAHLEAVRHDHPPVVVDLCTGSGALALAIAHARPDADVRAVELDPDALTWARHNADLRIAAGDTPITLYADDATDPALLTELNGRADIVVSNPPYIPVGAELDPEVADHDPHRALFGGADGLDVIRGLIPTVARLLRPGGGTAIEHDDSNGSQLAALLAETGAFTEITEHSDLAGKPRFVAAVRT
ncbi:peptide chain release factor N(5)-glutamine methyltransferase [Nocardia cyriacigeorgica]|uniref:Release factor glutamine methyltransferase n=1 Tax=Nocardia cyriacigeorgica (strain GUH-2) TaxID=1127134 RepID=H6R3H7_NOCCG|nr:peptide chain release factor N(5)-glutamine methyltransferase [Nocardia cyriacigeorgica]MBF6425444.1 peptide chain release factor N(5)-glutamine methyltransferase [Nocardia cyriacigeorgica]CCF61934.1 N5-glutamine methyltransferase, modifies release factors RF-1 and RF-2 [Nocardia cyriacigeorgica GUH-2]